MKQIISIYFAILFFAFGCSNKPTTNPKLQGLKEDDVVKLYGNPDTIIVFVLSDSKLYEYRYNLTSIYPEYRTDSIKIKEMLWEKGNKKTAVWFSQKETQWVVIDNLAWGKEIHF